MRIFTTQGARDKVLCLLIRLTCGLQKDNLITLCFQPHALVVFSRNSKQKDKDSR